jgi:hypothetical protein
MGQCLCINTSKRRVIHSTKLSALSELEAKRKTVAESIRNLHLISLDSAHGVEECLGKDERELALILKLKQLCVKERLQVLREVVRKIDDLLNGTPDLKEGWSDVNEEADRAVEGLEKAIYVDNVKEIVEGREQTVKEMKKDIGAHDLDRGEAEAELESEIEKRRNNGTGNRKRFTKRHLPTI